MDDRGHVIVIAPASEWLAYWIFLCPPVAFPKVSLASLCWILPSVGRFDSLTKHWMQSSWTRLSFPCLANGFASRRTCRYLLVPCVRLEVLQVADMVLVPVLPVVHTDVS